MHTGLREAKFKGCVYEELSGIRERKKEIHFSRTLFKSYELEEACHA
jgi:hypothetical protein